MTIMKFQLRFPFPTSILPNRKPYGRIQFKKNRCNIYVSSRNLKTVFNTLGHEIKFCMDCFFVISLVSFVYLLMALPNLVYPFHIFFLFQFKFLSLICIFFRIYSNIYSLCLFYIFYTSKIQIYATFCAFKNLKIVKHYSKKCLIALKCNNYNVNENTNVTI